MSACPSFFPGDIFIVKDGAGGFCQVYMLLRSNISPNRGRGWDCLYTNHEGYICDIRLEDCTLERWFTCEKDIFEFYRCLS